MSATKQSTAEISDLQPAIQARIPELVELAIIATDANGVVVYMNPFAEKLYGWKAHEAVGRTIPEVNVPQLSPDQAADVLRALQAGKSWSGETLVERRDGTTFLAAVTDTPVLDEHGRVLGAIGVSSDITDRRRAEVSVSESEERFRAAAEGSLDAVTILTCWRDEEGHVSDFVFTDLNVRAEEQLGVPRAGLIGRRISEALPAVQTNGHFEKYQQVFETGEPFEEDYVGNDSHGRPRWWHHQVVALADGVAISNRDVTEKKEAEERMSAQLRHTAALRSIDDAITASLDLRLTLNVVTEQVMSQLGADAAAVLLLVPHSHTLSYAAGRGFRTRGVEQTRLRLGEGLASRAVVERQLVHARAPIGPEFAPAGQWAHEGFVEYHVVPLIAKGKVLGVLEVFHREPFDADEDWRTFLEMLAGQTAIAADDARLFEELQRSNMELALAYDATIEGWSRALDLRDRETEGHTRRVTEITERLARAAGMSESEIAHIRRGALLHDIGKMAVPDHVLLKPDKLTKEEWAIMRQHPQSAFDMLAPIGFLRPALDIPYCHHEKWDGTGYPRGLKGEQIPMAARIFAVVDVWDALGSDRPYREAWTMKEAAEHIKAGSGTHFDPKAVELFFDVVGEISEEQGRWAESSMQSAMPRLR